MPGKYSGQLYSESNRKEEKMTSLLGKECEFKVADKSGAEKAAVID